MTLVLAANAGATISFFAGFVGFFLLATGIADGGTNNPTAAYGLLICIVAGAGLAIFN